MKSFGALLKKDWHNHLQSIGPALLLSGSLLLLIQWTQSPSPANHVAWESAFCLSFFVASMSVFYRSFGQEHASQNFQIYTAFNIARWKILLSQSMLHLWTLILLAGSTFLLTFIFWPPFDYSLSHIALLSLFFPLCLAPLGALLGLMLQREREFLFAITYLPLATPIFLGLHQLLSQGFAGIWLRVLFSFALVSGFLSFFVFENYFDELTKE